MIVKTLEKEDGKWWVECKLCNHNTAIIVPKPSSVRLDGGEAKWDCDFACEKCNGPIRFQRVEITGTIELDDPTGTIEPKDE